MGKLVADETIGPKLARAAEEMEVVDVSGKALGLFFPFQTDPGLAARSPFSREEIEKRRREPGGSPLAEVLRELERA